MKALIGSWESPTSRLSAENATLRRRVAELQDALERAQRENDALAAALMRGADVDLQQDVPVLSS